MLVQNLNMGGFILKDDCKIFKPSAFHMDITIGGKKNMHVDLNLNLSDVQRVVSPKSLQCMSHPAEAKQLMFAEYL